MDFEKICMMFTMEEPYYGILLSSMDRAIAPPQIKTIAVAKSGNVFKLLYNPDFVNRLPVDTILQLLKHECMHVAFGHFTMWDEEAPDEGERFLRNCAEDFEINGYLDRNKIAKEAGGLFCEDMGWNKFEGTREYYKKLQDMADQMQQQKQQAQSPSQPCNGGQGGQAMIMQTKGQKSQNQQNQQGQPNNQNNQQPQQGQGQPSQGNNPSQGQPQQGNGQPQQSQPQNNGSGDIPDEMRQDLENRSFDDHSLWPKDMTEAEKDILNQTIEELVAFAADEVEKGHGTIPGELVGRINAIRNRKKPKPAADWKRFFRRYVGNEFTEFIRKSKKRESRRFPDAAGNRHRRKANILVAIDTSGSVSMPEYQEFFGQIQTLTATTNFHVLECDARIQHEYDYKGKPNMTLHGGGGTLFEPVIDYFIEHRKDYEALIYFTDGGAWIPNNTPKETLWVISSKGDHDRSRYKVNGAKVVFIPPKQ